MIRLFFQPAILIIILSFGFFGKVGAQATGSLILVSDKEANVFVNGEQFGSLKANKPKKIEVLEGEHYLQIVSVDNNEEKNEILAVESGKQKVLKYNFQNSVSNFDSDAILVTDIDFNIPGILTQSAEEGGEFATRMFAFEKGDEIIMNLDMANAKGTNNVQIFTYPDNNIKYSNDSFQDLKDVKIKTIERSIYVFSFSSNHTFDRSARLVIERIPESDSTRNFNTAVSRQAIYKAKPIQKPLDLYINSGSNASLKGGKSRVVIPVDLPSNTVKWYYTFSAKREEDQIGNVSNSLSLLADLSELLVQTRILSFGIDQLTQPPGSDYCDIYLMDHDNSGLFTSKEPFRYYPIGSRENIKSGIVEIEGYAGELMYLGLKNPDDFHGIHVLVEVVAIVKEEGWVMHDSE